MNENKNAFKNALKDIKPTLLYMNNNNNIDYNNMTKNIKLNVDFLKRMVKKVKNEDLKEKANIVIQLYADRKISQITQPEKQITSFINYEKSNQKQQNNIDKSYDKMISKYQDSKPLSQRMDEKKKEKATAKISASQKIQNLARNTLTFESKVIEKAFKKNVIVVRVKPKYIGSMAAVYRDIFVAKAYLLARKQVPRDANFIIWFCII